MLSETQTEEVSQLLREKILGIFRHEGFLTYSGISEPSCLKIINARSHSIMEEDFKPEIISDIFEHASKNKHGQISPHSLAQSFVEAVKNLNDKIMDAEKQNGYFQDRFAVLKEKRKELRVYEKQNNMTAIHELREQIEEIQSEIQELDQGVNTFKEQLRLILFLFIENDGKTFKKEVISKETSHRWRLKSICSGPKEDEEEDAPKWGRDIMEEKSSTLAVLFYLTTALLIVQLLMLTLELRLTMLPIQLSSLSFFVLLLGYFHFRAVEMLIASFFGSVLLDIIYVSMLIICSTSLNSSSILCPCEDSLILRVKNLWKVHNILLMLGSWAIRFVLGVKWWKFRKPQTKKSYYFKLFGTKILLNKRIVVDRHSDHRNKQHYIGQ